MNNIKQKKVKLILLLVSAILLLMLGVSLLYLNLGLNTRASEKIADSSVSALAVYDDIVLIGDSGGQLYAADDTKTGNVIYSFDSKILALGKLGNNIVAVTENREISLVTLTGELISSRRLGYNPQALQISGNNIVVTASMSVTRNRVYMFDEQLKLQNLIPDTDTPPQNPNESDLLYEERLKALSLDYPIAEAGYYEDTGMVVVSAYSYIYIYNNGEVTDRVLMQHSPVSMDFGKDSIVVSDLSGGYTEYSLGLQIVNQVDNSEVAATVQVYDEGVFLTTVNGSVYNYDKSGSLQYSFGVQGRIRYSAFGDTLSAVAFSDSQKAAIYHTAAMGSISVVKTMNLIIGIITVLFIIINVVLVLANFRPRAYNKLKQQTIKTSKGLFISKWALIAVTPAVLLAAVFAYYPAINGFILAFFHVEVDGINTFAGLQNFTELLSKQYFWNGIGNMLLFLFTDLLKALIPAFIIAELLIAMRSKRAQYVSRVLMFIPGILPGVAAMLIWKDGIFGMNGVVNSFLTGLNINPINWLGDSRYALGSLIMFGFPWIGSYIILYGALNGIPSSYYEAAQLDGCSWIKRLILIDLPMISSQMKYIFIMTFIGSVQDFQRVFLTTEGAFGTYVPMLEMYYNLTLFNNYGMAAAMGLVLFVVLMIATLANLKIKTVETID